MKRTVLVPFVFLYPCDSCPNSLHIASVQIDAVTGSSARSLYLVMVSLVTGCTTALQVGRKHVSVSWKIEFALCWEMHAGRELFCFEAWVRSDCRRGGILGCGGLVSSCDLNGVFVFLLG